MTRKTTERLFDFSLRLAERRKKRGKPGRLTLVDKANVFKAFNWQRDIFDERKTKFPGCNDRHALCRCLRRHDGEAGRGTSTSW